MFCRALLVLLCITSFLHADPPKLFLSTFEADVTPPIGHPCMGGGIAPVAKIEDPLFAKGFVLTGRDEPIVVLAIDWCEIRNDAYERWRNVIAEAASTKPNRVIVSALHQHDAPIADLTAQKFLEAAKAKGNICDLKFHEEAVQRVAVALKEGIKKKRLITHIGTGQAKVEKVASNRRYLDKDGAIRFNRMSATRDPLIRAGEEGVIDPWLKTLSFWDGDTPLLALSAYATHPMSYYGKGGVTSDFVGLARKRRQTDVPSIFQMYVSGCSGNITAGKYNDGSVENRPILAERIYKAMAAAFESTKRQPITSLDFRSGIVKLSPRFGPEFEIDHLKEQIAKGKRPFDQCLAAFGLSWRERVKTKPGIDIPVLDFGDAVLTLLPAEAYVEYQLMAQRMRPKDFVVVIGYGECAPGYIPTDKHWKEGDGNLSDWCWVAPGAEDRIEKALRKVLVK